MIADIQGALVMAALFTTMVAVAEGLARTTRIPPEISRKLVHLGGGLGCLLFPLLVENSLSVLILAVSFGFGLWIGEERGLLKCLSGVRRRSKGSLYYPFAIAALFHLSSERYWLYFSGVMILTVSDTAAALVGGRYGSIRYRAGGAGEKKSLQGALAFWAITFMIVYVPLRISGEFGVVQTAMAAFLTATLLTGTEAVASGGRDNLYVPLLAALILIKAVGKSGLELTVQSASLIIVFSLVFAVNRLGRMLRTEGVTTMGIMVFGTWCLGSADWAIPLVLAFASVAVVFRLFGMEQRKTILYRRLTLATMPAVALVVLANITGSFDFWFGPFLAAVTLPTLWGILIHSRDDRPGSHWILQWKQMLSAIAAAAVILIQPVASQHPVHPLTLTCLSLGVLILAWIGSSLRMTLQAIHPPLLLFLFIFTAISLIALGQRQDTLKPWQPRLWACFFDRDPDVMFPSGSGKQEKTELKQ